MGLIHIGLFATLDLVGQSPGAVPSNLTLLEPPVASPKGVVYLRYGLAEGTLGRGDVSAPDRGAGRDG